jgi:hypothetical protein
MKKFMVYKRNKKVHYETIITLGFREIDTAGSAIGTIVE